MTASRDQGSIQTLSSALSVKDYRCLPEKFSIEDIKPILSQEKIASLKKIHDLWREGVNLEIYGSFVVQCGMILAGKKPTSASDIDVASSITPLKDCPILLTQLNTHGFKEKKLQPQTNPFLPKNFYSYEFNDGNINVDFTVRLPTYDKNHPNTLLLSEITMKFIKSENAEITLKFDNRHHFLLEYYCNHSMYPLATPHTDERGVIRRILKQIKNNKHLYDRSELHMYYKHQKVESFTKDDIAWRKITNLLKDDFKKKIGTKKFISYFNEMSRMVKEKTFCMTEASLFIENFCEVVIEHHDKRLQHKNAAAHMTAILQKYFVTHEQEADKFPEIVNFLLRHDHQLDLEDELLLALDRIHADIVNKNRFFGKPNRNLCCHPGRSKESLSLSLKAR